METMTASSSLPLHQDPGNHDEVSMEKNMFLSENLKDLKNLRKQLYSAAEYFELSYTHDDKKQIVADTLKDYAIKACVSAVDHLCSVTYKVNDLLEERVDDVSGAELRVSCIEQRLQTCQIYIDHEGLSQQSLLINTPKYHKQYILQVGETKPCANDTKSKYKECNLGDEHDRRPRKKEKEKQMASPHRFSLLRYGSLSSRPTTPKKSRPRTPTPSRPTTPNASNGRRQYPSELQRSMSLQFHAQTQNPKETEHYPSKGKRLLKALLSRRKSKNDAMLYTYLDEY